MLRILSKGKILSIKMPRKMPKNEKYIKNR